LGWLTYHAGSFSESIAFYNKAVAIRPLGIEPRLGLVLPLSALGNWDQIIDQYTTILEIDPQNSIVNYRMGAIYYERKNFEKAEYHCKKVVNLYPFDHDSLLLLAWIKLEQGNSNEAKLLFNKVLLNNPGDKSALHGLSLLEK
jgi:tetratricopeptide (TPR) repeat protein